MLLAMASPHAARAQELPRTAPALPTTLFFVGGDASRGGASAYGGLLWSPGGLDGEGLTLKLVSGAGTYHYRSGTLGEVTGAEIFGSALPGWRFRWDKLEIAAFAGLDVQSHHLTPDDAFARLRGFRAGLRAGADLWYQPSETTMLALNAWAGSIGPDYWTRAAVGWRAFDAVWIGPEAQALGNAWRSREVRAGVHLTSLRTSDWEWSAGVGRAWTADGRDGVYGRIGVLTRR